MNREIKFRVWDKSVPANTSKKELSNPSGMMINWDYVKESTYLLSAINGKYQIMQFTGIKDKNGVEIYEGDVVLMDNKWNVEVVFGLHSIGKDSWDIEHASPMFCGKFKDNSGYTGLDFPEGYEVIGNVYETPELINQVS